MNKIMKTYKVIKNVKEARGIHSLYLEIPEIAKKAKPGQFVMVWDPSTEEIPLSISSIDNDVISITIKEVGECTASLNKKKEGDFIGVTGPFGNFFDLNYDKILVVAGGIGLASVSQIESFKSIIGAKTKEELFWANKPNAIVCTDDGSFGEKGLVTALLEKELNKNKYDCVICCGPKVMIDKCFEITKKHGVDFQASLERVMKCGIGICGSCAIGPTGWRVCKDGPVINGKDYEKIIAH